jgi:hypothetical protein
MSLLGPLYGQLYKWSAMRHRKIYLMQGGVGRLHIRHTDKRAQVVGACLAHTSIMAFRYLLSLSMLSLNLRYARLPV